MNVNDAKFRELLMSLYGDEYGISEASHNPFVVRTMNVWQGKRASSQLVAGSLPSRK